MRSSAPYAQAVPKTTLRKNLQQIRRRIQLRRVSNLPHLGRLSATFSDKSKQVITLSYLEISAVLLYNNGSSLLVQPGDWHTSLVPLPLRFPIPQAVLDSLRPTRAMKLQSERFLEWTVRSCQFHHRHEHRDTRNRPSQCALCLPALVANKRPF